MYDTTASRWQHGFAFACPARVSRLSFLRAHERLVLMKISRRHFLELSSAAALSPALVRCPSSADSATSELCRKLAADPLRPQYHLLPAHNWMNDPNGPIYFGERYHMFHQYNPQSAVWGNMNWAHATSPDMVHWQHEAIALSPTPNGA